MNDLQPAVLLGLLAFAIALIANAIMVALGVASPILGMAEEDAVIWIKKLIEGFFH